MTNEELVRRFIEEKPALLRLRIKVNLGILGIPQSDVWDEPSVIADEEKVKPKPDLIAIRDEGIWWWEIKDWKNAVGVSQIKELFQAIQKVHRAKTTRFISEDGKKELTNIKIAKVTVICGEGGFTALAYTLGREYKFDLKKPNNLRATVAVVKRLSKKKDRLLGVEIRIFPIGSKETFVAPDTIKLLEVKETGDTSTR